ncbi:bicyclomycin resistance-like protein [Actinobacillus equuli]|nr:bicyclomycin resistance-like protein [Actinobacillus equuli]
MGVSCVFLISWKIPETLVQEKRQPLRFGIVFKNFWKLLSDKNVLGYVLVGA